MGLVGGGVLLGPGIVAQTGPDSAPGTEVILRGLPVNSFTRVGDVREGRRDALDASATATINVTYNGFSAAAQAAFQYAVDIWETKIVSTVPIEVVANWTPLESGILGSAGPHYITQNFSNAPVAYTWYHAALANALIGSDPHPSWHDINANFNSTYTNCSTAPTPTGITVPIRTHPAAHLTS